MRERSEPIPELALELLRLTDENLLRLRGSVAAASVMVDGLLDRQVVVPGSDERTGLRWALLQAGEAVDALSEDLHRVLEMARKPVA